LSQLAQFGQLKTKGNGQTIGAPSTTERREIHRKSAFRRNDTKNKTVLRTASENRHGKRRRWWPSTNAHNWLRFPASQHLGTRPRTRRLLANLSSSREQDRETNGLIDGLGTRTPSAAHQTIAFTRTRQRNKRSHRRAGNKDPERCSPNDRKRCRIRDRSHYLLTAIWFTCDTVVIDSIGSKQKFFLALASWRARLDNLERSGMAKQGCPPPSWRTNWRALGKFLETHLSRRPEV
jgi:hypothetical protein